MDLKVKQNLKAWMVAIRSYFLFRFNRVEGTYSKLLKYDEKKRADYIKNVFWYYSKANNQKKYNKLLKQFLPNLDIEFNRTDFKGFGLGSGSLDSFRKIELADSTYFEKIYFTGSSELENITWIYNNFYPQLSKQIIIPKIIDVYESEVLTVVYFDYLELEDLNQKDVEANLVSISKVINTVDIEGVGEGKTIFSKHFEFERRLSAALKRLNAQETEIKGVLERVLKSKRVLTHADLQQTNVFKNNTVTDWDVSGFYPIGFEQAFLYYRLLVEEIRKSNENPTDWLNKNFKGMWDQNDFEEMKYNFQYFLYVFCSRLFIKSRFNDLEKHLYEAVFK